MKRSNLKVMTRMMGLVAPLAGIMLLAILCGVAGFCCANFLPVVAVRGALIAVDPSNSMPITPYCIVLAAMAVARGVLHYIEQRSNHYIAFKLLAHIRDLVFAALRRLAPAKLAGADRGALISTITSDVELLEVFYAHTISPIVIAVLMTAIMCVFLGGIHPVLALVAFLAYVAVGVVVPVLTSRASGELGMASRDGAASLAGYVLDGLRGLSQVLQFRAGGMRLAELDRRGVPSIDLMGPAITVISALTGAEPHNIAGAIHDFNDKAYRRSDAMQFFVSHDDNRNPQDLPEADVIIAGISRTSKTPIATYLAFMGLKVAVIALRPDREPPAELADCPKERIFGLISPAEKLLELRKRRLYEDETIPASYATPEVIEKEQAFSAEVFDRLGCTVINTEGMAVEEVAAEILQMIGRG